MDPLSIDNMIRILLGCMALLAGRNIFWLFIAVIGFLLGTELAQVWLAGQPLWLMLAAGSITGLVGAALALLYQRVAFALAGFYAVAFLVVMYMDKPGFASVPAITPYVAGLVGALLAVLLTDWTIIVLSALAGAATIVSVLVLPPPVEAVSFLALALTGILVQKNMLAHRQHQ